MNVVEEHAEICIFSNGSDPILDWKLILNSKKFTTSVGLNWLLKIF